MTRKGKARLLFVLVVLAGLALLLQRAPTLTARGLERALSGFFHRDVSVREVRFRLWPLEAEVLGLEVAGPKPGTEPFLVVPRVVAAPALGPLWLRRLVLARLRIEAPRIRVHAYPEGGDDIPKMGGGRGGALEFRVRRLVIEKGEFQLDHQRVPLQLDLPNVRGRLDARIAGSLGGNLSFGPGKVRFGQNPELELQTDMQLRLEGPLLSVERGRVRAQGTDLAYEGQMQIASRPRGEFSLKGPVDLELLDRHVMRTGLGIKGAGEWDGRAWVDGSRVRLRGALAGREGEFDGEAVSRFRGQVAWDEGGVHVRELEVEALSGSGRLNIEVPPGPSVASLEAQVREADAEAALRWIFDVGPLTVGSAATGDIKLSWPRGRFRELSGTPGLDLLAKTDGRTPLWGRYESRALKGSQTVEKADLHTPDGGARLQGRVELDQSADLALDVESRDVAATDELLARIRRALGVADAIPAGFSGRGEFHGRWLGTLRDPRFEGRFVGEEVGYLGVSWGSARWSGSLSPGEVRSTSLELQRGDGLLRIEGRVETGYYGDKDGLDVKLRALQWPAEDLLRALGMKAQLEGPISGEFALHGRRSAPLGEGRLLARAGRYYGMPFEDLDVRAALREGATEVRDARVRVGGGTLLFKGTLSDAGFYDGTVDAREVEVAELLRATAVELPLGGRVSGNLTLQGPLERPRARAQLRSARLFFGDEGLGAVEAAFTGKGDGALGVDVVCRSPRVKLALHGAVKVAASADAELKLSVEDTSLDPFVRVLYPGLPPPLTVIASGEAVLRGPLRTPRELRGEGSLSELLINLPEYPVRNTAPIRFQLGQGAVRVVELGLQGEGTDLRVLGAAGFAGSVPLELNVEGNADLRALSAVTRRLRGRGAARLAMSVRGTADAPRVDGTLELTGAGLRVRNFPTGIEGLRGSVRFSERAARLEGVNGTLGGGALTLEGQAGYEHGKLASVDLLVSGRRIALRYPEGLRSALDLDLRLFGDDARQWLTGSIDVRHALWTRRYDLASELLAATALRTAAPASLREGLRYDIKVRAPGTLEVDNNLATLRASADLSLAGTSESPAILGRAEIERGRVYFQGNTYTIRRGTIDFANPQRVEPVFNIEAETRIRSYRVNLSVSGTLERAYPTLSSDPPLSAVQIVNLLAGADENAVTSLTQAQSEQAKLAAAGAATLAAGRLSEQVGLERQAQRLFGLNRFSIDPALVHGDVANPTARLTVGKRITPDLSVLYSIDLKSGQEQLLSVEYTLSDRFSVLITSAEIAGLGVDIRVRQTR